MLIVDQNPRLNEKSVLNARAVAIFGFSIFGKEHSYLLNKNFEIDYKTLNSFLEKNGNKKFLIFGFTSLIYENLIKKISTKLLNYNFNKGILLHGGGWKKLEALKVSNKIFNIGTSKPQSVNRLVSLLKGKSMKIPKRPGEPNKSQADIKKVKKYLNWQPNISFKDGVEELKKNITYWKTAPLWTSKKISRATKEWFKYLK